MNSPRVRTVLLMGIFGGFGWWLSACGDGGSGPEEVKTNAVLMGQVVLLGSSDQTGDIKISIGNKSTRTKSDGTFSINHIPIGENTATFSGSGIMGPYSLTGIEQGTVVNLEETQVAPGQVTTKHTGTWVGTAGSTEPGSQGQITFTMVIEANGNALTGIGQLAPPDSSTWEIEGKETGTTVDGEMRLLFSYSECATGGEFTGTFAGDTLSGTFIEVDPPAECGTPESGTFKVVKQH
ncbi:MAG: hypothetical protein PVJ76_10360 [Gemmatimonadota bacterium]